MSNEDENQVWWHCKCMMAVMCRGVWSLNNIFFFLSVIVFFFIFFVLFLVFHYRHWFLMGNVFLSLYLLNRIETNRNESTRIEFSLFMRTFFGYISTTNLYVHMSNHTNARSPNLYKIQIKIEFCLISWIHS